MCCIVIPEAVDSGKNILSTKWVKHDRETVVVSPAEECVFLLRNPAKVNGIMSKGMWAKCKGKVLVSCKDYSSYTMADVSPLLLDYKVVLPKGHFNGLHAHYYIRTDPDLGLGWAVLRWVACGCEPCKDQLKRPRVPLVEPMAQPRYAQNKECVMWPSYEGANN